MSDADTSSPLLMTEFDYQLPTDLIAQFPLERRSESRLLVLDRSKPELEFTRFDQLPQFLNPGDVLVFNDSRVLPARLLGARATGGAVEFLLLRRIAGNRWRALAKPAAKLRPGELIIIHSKSGENSATATLAMKHSDGQVEIELDRELAARLSDYGRMPLPPYITQRLDDDDRYQTVYS
ncbi:MAG: S-adenosylmethionine:tRNA ribosyltransferase-isomerase, partial [Thermomicrobiales bacterium]